METVETTQALDNIQRSTTACSDKKQPTWSEFFHQCTYVSLSCRNVCTISMCNAFMELNNINSIQPLLLKRMAAIFDQLLIHCQCEWSMQLSIDHLEYPSQDALSSCATAKMISTLLLLLMSWRHSDRLFFRLTVEIRHYQFGYALIYPLLLSITWNPQSICPCSRSSIIATYKCPSLLSLYCFWSLGILNQDIRVPTLGSLSLSNAICIFFVGRSPSRALSPAVLPPHS